MPAEGVRIREEFSDERCPYADIPDASCECRQCMREAIRRDAARDGITVGDWLKNEEREEDAEEYSFDPEELDLTTPEPPMLNGNPMTLAQALSLEARARVAVDQARAKGGFWGYDHAQRDLVKAERDVRYVTKLQPRRRR